MKTKNNTDTNNQDHLDIIAAGLVHEIKNPLNTISVNLQLINEDLQECKAEKDLKTSRRVQILQKEVCRLENILSDFLRFAKKHGLHFEKCDINEIVDSVLDFIAPEAMGKSIRVLKGFNTDLPLCDVDSNEIKQALLNLILNAQQAMPEGGELIVRTGKAGEYIYINGTDTGIGIPHDKTDKIFQVYYSTKKAGTGLGLPTAKRIIEDHKGIISVHSEADKGSSFTIKIPIHQPAQSDLPPGPGEQNHPGKDTAGLVNENS